MCHTIAENYQPTLSRSICPETEILVTNGASQGIYLSLVSMVEKGDEVILIEPAFDIYGGAVAMAGGTARYLPLRSPDKISDSNDFYLDYDELEETINEKTKVLILNSPHNPTGKVFSESEYKEIARILRKYPNVKVISDEVYEHLVFDGHKHIPFACIDEMGERTLSIYSAENIFSDWLEDWLDYRPQRLS